MKHTQQANKTHQVVREAVKIASRDVQAPRVVREGVVTKSSDASLLKR